VNAPPEATQQVQVKNNIGPKAEALAFSIVEQKASKASGLAVKQRINSDDPVGQELVCRNPLLER